MSKKIFLLIPFFLSFVFALLLISLSFLVKEVRAIPPMDNCTNTVQTEPANLNSKSDNAIFTIDLGKFYDPTATKWTIQFECGPDLPIAGQQIVNATIGSDKKTLTTDLVQRSRNPAGGCEFFPGDHTFLIKGDDRFRCRANYTVLDSDSQCILNIDPNTGILPNTALTVSGDNLTPGARFILYIDNNDVISGYLDTPKFSGIQIPTDKLTPRAHKIYLRRDRAFDFRLPFEDRMGPILCPRTFKVGTPDEPGAVDAPGTFRGTPCASNCSSAGGFKTDETKECTDNKDHPGIITAIGCIHTNPAEFVKDLMTWVIGIGGGIAFLMMLLGAFQMLTSAGNPDTLRAGRERLSSAVIGLLIVIFSVLLLQIIGFDILRIPDFGR